LTVQTDTRTLIEETAKRFLAEVPALVKLKTVVGLELHSRSDVQLYRVEMPGPRVTKAIAPDAKITVQIQRAKFNELAARGHLADWRLAFERGDAKATGVEQYLQLIQRVVETQEERARTRRARPR
jgi:hypothetical protein